MLCSFPLWLIIVAVFVADSVRWREKRHHILSSSIVIAAIGTMTSLSYRVCGSGLKWNFDSQSTPVAAIYRGYPLPWFGWIGLDSVIYPTIALLGDLLIWFLVALATIQLLSLAQLLLQFKLSRSDKIVISGCFVALLPIMIALVGGGKGC
jgi:hypothetical protein